MKMCQKTTRAVNYFLTNFDFNISKNVILPKYSILMFIRFIHQEKDDMWSKDQDTMLQNGSIQKVRGTDDRTNLLPR
jgi:hypothetical protein